MLASAKEPQMGLSFFFSHKAGPARICTQRNSSTTVQLARLNACLTLLATVAWLPTATARLRSTIYALRVARARVRYLRRLPASETVSAPETWPYLLRTLILSRLAQVSIEYCLNAPLRFIDRV